MVAANQIEFDKARHSNTLETIETNKNSLIPSQNHPVNEIDSHIETLSLSSVKQKIKPSVVSILRNENLSKPNELIGSPCRIVILVLEGERRGLKKGKEQFCFPHFIDHATHSVSLLQQCRGGYEEFMRNNEKLASSEIVPNQYATPRF